ncbi:Tetratricopeptide repeat protein [Caulifigura coniformis]|uniref:Tetratricopeptide repeat protein n=1 Tax=Caulifigura coniformis TaxID=2527983 RepID=A0A517SKA6_9PLAN|nr:tetratricopeptide repeat protein [Caulifigura coniformis]QDT56554.1 Tetratricopeptide repeat protein [Caulifigura coniformis]
MIARSRRNMVFAALLIGLSVVVGMWAWRAAGKSFAGLWRTPVQQGDRALRRHDYQAAAKLYADPFHRGVALYREGDFKQAAAEFGRDASAESWFNRGNALVMAGKYEDAITSYGEALKQRADWSAATQNLAIAKARLLKLHPPNDGSEGTDGQLKADEIVFDNKPKNTPGAKETETVAGEPLSDADIQSLWLRNVKTSPADFLKAKFAYQLSRQSAQEKP